MAFLRQLRRIVGLERLIRQAVAQQVAMPAEHAPRCQQHPHLTWQYADGSRKCLECGWRWRP